MCIAIDVLLLFFVAVLYAIDRRDSDSKAMAKRSNSDFDRIHFEKFNREMFVQILGIVFKRIYNIDTAIN